MGEREKEDMSVFMHVCIYAYMCVQKGSGKEEEEEEEERIERDKKQEKGRWSRGSRQREKNGYLDQNRHKNINKK